MAVSPLYAGTGPTCLVMVLWKPLERCAMFRRIARQGFLFVLSHVSLTGLWKTFIGSPNAHGSQGSSLPPAALQGWEDGICPGR